MPTPEAVITSTDYSTITNGILTIFLQSGPYGATIVDWLVQTVIVDYYITIRLAMTAVVFVVGFVTSRLRLGKLSLDESASLRALDRAIESGSSYQREQQRWEQANRRYRRYRDEL